MSDSVFEGCTSLVGLTIPESVEWIGSRAFMDCSVLSNITLPKNIKRIRENIFFRCSSLTSIDLVQHKQLLVIDSGAFGHCTALTSATIPNTVTQIQTNAFLGCSASLKIYCEHQTQPSKWSSLWNPENCTVVWGFANDFVKVNSKINNLGLADGATNYKIAFGKLNIPDAIGSNDSDIAINTGLSSIASITVTPMHIEGIDYANARPIVIREISDGTAYVRYSNANLSLFKYGDIMWIAIGTA